MVFKRRKQTKSKSPEGISPKNFATSTKIRVKSKVSFTEPDFSLLENPGVLGGNPLKGHVFGGDVVFFEFL